MGKINATLLPSRSFRTSMKAVPFARRWRDERDVRQKPHSYPEVMQ